MSVILRFLTVMEERPGLRSQNTAASSHTAAVEEVLAGVLKRRTILTHEYIQSVLSGFSQRQPYPDDPIYLPHYPDLVIEHPRVNFVGLQTTLDLEADGATEVDFCLVGVDVDDAVRVRQRFHT